MNGSVMNVLDVGCGKNKIKGAIGIDSVKLEGVDIVHDLNVFPYPLADNEFDEIYLTHILEHLDSIIKTMEEIHRIARPNARVIITTPHYSDNQSWTDPTHKWHLSSYSFRYFDPEYETNYYTKARFKVESLHFDMARLWRALGIQLLINLSIKYKPLRFVRKFWEHYLSMIIRAQAMTFILRVIK